MKKKVIIFDKDGGWILTNPKLSDYIGLPHIVNPDLSHVLGVPPEHLTLINGKIVEIEIPAHPLVGWYGLVKLFIRNILVKLRGCLPW